MSILFISVYSCIPKEHIVLYTVIVVRKFYQAIGISKANPLAKLVDCFTSCKSECFLEYYTLKSNSYLPIPIPTYNALYFYFQFCHKK